VLVYTLKKGINDTVLYDESAVMGRFNFGPKQVPDYKGLRGDPSDNIPGIKGVGEKTATELIVHFKTVEGNIQGTQEGRGLLRAVGIKERTIELLKANEEEALFSKMLATIRRDAPIEFTLPEKTWRDGLDMERVLTLFAELGFRTLATRVSNLFGVEITQNAVEAEELSVDAHEMQKTALALWLLSSDTTKSNV
jgi:DNA polymerase-1